MVTGRTGALAVELDVTVITAAHTVMARNTFDIRLGLLGSLLGIGYKARVTPGLKSGFDILILVSS